MNVSWAVPPVIAASVHGFSGATILIHGSEVSSASCLQVNVSVLAVFTMSTVVPKSEATDGSGHEKSKTFVSPRVAAVQCTPLKSTSVSESSAVFRKAFVLIFPMDGESFNTASCVH